LGVTPVCLARAEIKFALAAHTLRGVSVLTLASRGCEDKGIPRGVQGGREVSETASRADPA
jgi:hypothetical protein